MSRNPWMLPVAALAALEGLINRLIALDPEQAHRLGRLQGRVITVILRPMGLCVHLVPEADGLRLMGHWEEEADATVEGSPFALLDALRGAPGWRQEVAIRGDAELVRELQQTLAGLDIDWEEVLSRFTGDVIAHQIGNAVRGFFGWARRGSDNLREDVADYLQEERRVVPHPAEIETFVAEIDTLRDDVERLAARIERLRGR